MKTRRARHRLLAAIRHRRGSVVASRHKPPLGAFTTALVGALFGVSLAVVDVAGQGSLPTLQRVLLPSLETIGPEKSTAAIAISPTGMLAFTGSFDSRDRAVTILDSAGRVMARVGPPGQGPGELSMPVHLAFAGGEVIAVELAARRISRFGVDGTAHGTATMPAPMFLVGSTGDSLDMLQFPAGGPNPVLDFRRISPVSMGGRLLLSGQSPALRELSTEGQQQGASLASIVYIADGAAVVAANVASYHLVGIGPDGSTSFDIRGSRANTPPGETPLFSIGGLQRDAMQRIWALGTDQQTGRSFADLYFRGRPLGRLDLPCKGSVAVAGTWLAILCTTPASADRDVALSVYRLVER